MIAALHRDWGGAQGNYDGFRFFTGVRPSEQIALVMSGYDAGNGVLSVTTACVNGIDRDRIKTNEDRRVVLCARPRSVLKRQLALREELLHQRRIHHEHLFFEPSGRPIQRLHGVHRRRHRSSASRSAIAHPTPRAARPSGT